MPNASQANSAHLESSNIDKNIIENSAARHGLIKEHSVQLQARPTALRLLPVEVRRGPQIRRGPRSRAGSGGPARPTAIKSWQMRSGEEKEKEKEKEKEPGS